MESVLLVLPDFAIILLGLWLSRRTSYPRAFWDGAESIVFNWMLPPLLFMSVSQSHFTLGDSAHFLAVGIGSMMTGVVAAWLVRYLVKADNVTHASVFQCGFRFNTYIGFALCSRFLGDEGLSLMSLLIALWVPISNSIAVAVLASAVAMEKGDGHPDRTKLVLTTVKAVFKNPLILATLAGLAVNILGIHVPRAGADFLRHLGNASLAMGLLSIGAGLRLGELRGHMGLILAASVERLVVVPLFASLFIYLFGLTGTAAGVVLIFAALPTAQSCYVMTAGMGGNAPMVAAVTTAQTLLSMVTLSVLVLLCFA
ncbi:AEC family transporter [Sutterella sp.]|uniref:AEC family transporter n=1 Tax=Sutterella sp. TaxID=1981025 RepID=UPI0026E0826C|nr:AEC family transporter [Sutterella sp.]MDO5532979.1 AEC family transporter [Sutterella sp.]